MIGYGDIILPGMFISYLRSVDMRILEKNRGINAKVGSYFAVGIFGYIMGLVQTNVALRLMRMSQPALLWIVPSLFFSCYTLALIRKEARALWSDQLPLADGTGPDEDSENLIDAA